MSRDGLSARERDFVQAYVYGPETRGNATASFRAAGYSPRTANANAARLMVKDGVATAIAAAQAEKLAAVAAEGIANLQNRLADYQALRDALAATKDARAADRNIALAPGGTGGLVTIQYKTIPNADPTLPPITVQEAHLDTPMVTAWLAVLKQAAIEQKDWAEKPGLSVDITVRLQELAVQFNLPLDEVRARLSQRLAEQAG